MSSTDTAKSLDKEDEEYVNEEEEESESEGSTSSRIILELKTHMQDRITTGRRER
jgi:hypothetical protein